ncbi:Tox-REase-5 domain-containing protein [Streptomyces geranii]|uniref:Tox-REase-5 domain-containing protein n=1 Tax=Streptomyces geranii TaxID=2058923 RepID=UPI000D0295C8|nr:Tox-REase-5 domain-containing protein [Streptomyces geranii]
MKSTDPEFIYQQTVTDGVPLGFVYKVSAPSQASGFVKFDGYKNGTLIDAKYLHYPDSFIEQSTGKLRFPTKETGTMKKQVEAANGVPVVWYVDNERTAIALRHWAVDNNVKGIEITFRPVPVTG